MKKTISINILAPIIIALGLWLGFTGRVSWWILLFIVVSDLAITAKFDVRP